MFGKKNKEKNLNFVHTTERREVTFHQSSSSLSYSATHQTSRPTLSEALLFANLPPKTSTYQGSTNSFLTESRELPISNSSNVGLTQIDAKPINPNYVSPYRNSPVYRSYSETRSPQLRPASISSYHPPLPATVINSSPEVIGKIVVKKTGKHYDGDCTIPTYKTSSKNRGEVLIINNIMFKNKGERSGAKKDDENLKILFKEMGFKVTVERDLKKSGMIHEVKKFSRKASLKSADISIVIVMSHGTKNTTNGGTEVFGLDEEGILADDLILCFNENDCKSMAGKPKIFFFQCCRGDNELFIQSDSQRTPEQKSALTNALIAYSTLPGFVSYRDPKHGTWYIQTLCDIFSKHAHEHHVEDLLKMVNERINRTNPERKQTTQYDNRGFKRCFLHPV